MGLRGGECGCKGECVGMCVYSRMEWRMCRQKAPDRRRSARPIVWPGLISVGFLVDVRSAIRSAIRSTV